MARIPINVTEVQPMTLFKYPVFITVTEILSWEGIKTPTRVRHRMIFFCWDDGCIKLSWILLNPVVF